MSGIVFQCKAEKVVNRSGGHVTKTVKEETTDAMGIKHTFHKHMVSKEKVHGSDYVVFMCPACNKRNKRSVYEVKGRVGNALSFICNGCRREIEVSPPDPGKRIIAQSNLVGPSGLPLR